MAAPVRYSIGVAASGDFDSDAAGTTAGGTALHTQRVKAGSVSALFTVDAETNTITLAAKIQVSDDNSTWYDFAPLNNAATVVLATGTGGADAAVSKVIEVPEAASAWKYIRGAVVSGVTTGASTDTYSIQLRHIVDTGFR